MTEARRQLTEAEWFKAVLSLACIVAIVAVLWATADSEEYAEREAEEPPLSQKLAAIESKSLSGVYDSTLSSSIQRRLERLAGKFPETEQQIADMTVKAQQLLESERVSKSLRQIMDDVDYMIPSGELGVTYAESAAMYVTMQSQ